MILSGARGPLHFLAAAFCAATVSLPASPRAATLQYTVQGIVDKDVDTDFVSGLVGRTFTYTLELNTNDPTLNFGSSPLTFSPSYAQLTIGENPVKLFNGDTPDPFSTSAKIETLPQGGGVTDLVFSGMQFGMGNPSIAIIYSLDIESRLLSTDFTKPISLTKKNLIADPSLDDFNFYRVVIDSGDLHIDQHVHLDIDSLIITNSAFPPPSPSPVPLPPAAPLFGAALLALRSVGYGLKRKAAAAA